MYFPFHDGIGPSALLFQVFATYSLADYFFEFKGTILLKASRLRHEPWTLNDVIRLIARLYLAVSGHDKMTHSTRLLEFLVALGSTTSPVLTLRVAHKSPTGLT